MIRKGCRTGAAGNSGIRQYFFPGASAVRALTPASSHDAADRAATQSRLAKANTTMTATGVSANTVSAVQRSTPRRDSTTNAAVRLTAAATRPTANKTRLFHSAIATTSATARNARTKLSRASHRRPGVSGSGGSPATGGRTDMPSMVTRRQPGELTRCG